MPEWAAFASELCALPAADERVQKVVEDPQGQVLLVIILVTVVDANVANLQFHRNEDQTGAYVTTILFDRVCLAQADADLKTVV